MKQSLLSYKSFTLTLSFLLISFGLIIDPIQDFIPNIITLLTHSATLIADFVEISRGAVFVNSGFVMIISIILIKKQGKDYTGLDLAAIGLMGSFAFLGKNFINIIPFIIGGYIFSKVNKVPFSSIITTTLFATSLCPIITDILLSDQLAIWISIPLSLICGIILIFIIIPLSKAVPKMHQGFSLYNVGLTTGLISTAYVAIMRSFAYNIESQRIWGNELQNEIIVLLIIILAVLLLFALLNGQISWKGFKELNILDNRGGCDYKNYIELGNIYLNMFITGTIGCLFVYFTQSSFNGGTLCGIFSIIAFSAYGKTAYSIIPLISGVYIGSFFKIWNINDPNIILVALFSSSLAPFTTIYGPLCGIIAGFILSSVSSSIALLHDGTNLYNTGFSAGVVAMTLAPVLDYFEYSLLKQKKHFRDKTL